MVTLVIHPGGGNIMAAHHGIPPEFPGDPYRRVLVPDDSELVTEFKSFPSDPANGCLISTVDIYPDFKTVMTESKLSAMTKADVARLAQARAYTGDALNTAKISAAMIKSFLSQQEA